MGPGVALEAAPPVPQGGRCVTFLSADGGPGVNLCLKCPLHTKHIVQDQHSLLGESIFQAKFFVVVYFEKVGPGTINLYFLFGKFNRLPIALISFICLVPIFNFNRKTRKTSRN